MHGLAAAPLAEDRNKAAANPNPNPNLNPNQNYVSNPFVFGPGGAANRLNPVNPVEIAITPKAGDSVPAAATLSLVGGSSLPVKPVAPDALQPAAQQTIAEKPAEVQANSIAQEPQTSQTTRAEGNSGQTVSTTGSGSTTAEHHQTAESLVNRIGSNLMQAANGGKVMRMRLEPPELGILQIEVTSREGTVTARLDVDNARASRALHDNLPQLHAMLNRTNTPVDRIEINVLGSQSGLEGQSNHSSNFSSGGNSSEQAFLPPVSSGIEDRDSRADANSLRNSRQIQDWQSRSNLLSGIDIQV